MPVGGWAAGAERRSRPGAALKNLSVDLLDGKRAATVGAYGYSSHWVFVSCMQSRGSE